MGLVGSQSCRRTDKDFTHRLRPAFVLLLLLSITSAQLLWETRYNGTGNWADYPTAIDFSGPGLYVTGMSYGDTSYYDFVTIVYDDTNGDLRWIRRYNSEFNGYDCPTAMKEGIVTGYSQGISGYDFLTLRYDDYGNLLWERRFNGPGNSDDIPYCLELDGEGNIYVAGISFIDTLGAYDCCLLKYSNNGDTLWRRFYNSDSNGNDIPQGIAIDRDGNIILAVYSWGGERSKFDFLVLKYDAGGNLLFARRFNGPGSDDDYPRAVAIGYGDSIYIAGTSYGQNADYWLLKLDPNGNLIWERRVDRGWDDHLWAMSHHWWDCTAVTGYSYSPISGYDIWTISYDGSGYERWQEIYDGGGQDFGYGIIASGDYFPAQYVIGCSQNRQGDYDFISLRYGPFGGDEFRHIYNGPAGGNDYGRVVSIAPHPHHIAELLAVAGYSEGVGSYYDYYTVLYEWPVSGVKEDNLSSDNKVERKASSVPEVYDIMGRKVKEIEPSEFEKFRGSEVRKLKALPAGVYILKPVRGKTKKIVIY